MHCAVFPTLVEPASRVSPSEKSELVICRDLGLTPQRPSSEPLNCKSQLREFQPLLFAPRAPAVDGASCGVSFPDPLVFSFPLFSVLVNNVIHLKKFSIPRCRFFLLNDEAPCWSPTYIQFQQYPALTTQQVFGNPLTSQTATKGHWPLT